MKSSLYSNNNSDDDDDESTIDAKKFILKFKNVKKVKIATKFLKNVNVE